jgi:glycerol-3-phosphate dehydrogenase
MALAEKQLDVLIVGGGIVGAGVARDAAMRGLRTGLVEQFDFASGTSSRSSRLLHGGMRYLAQGRLALVREASREKTVLGRIAPHLAQPLAFIFPTRKGGTWSHWKLSLGVKLYDLLCGMRNFGRSSSLSRRETLQLLPALETRNLTGGVRYFDALTNDARLVLDTLRSAARNGAALCNYVRLLGAEQHGGAWRCDLQDGETGETLIVRTRCVVNAPGPNSYGAAGFTWVLVHQELNVLRNMDLERAQELIRYLLWSLDPDGGQQWNIPLDYAPLDPLVQEFAREALKNIKFSGEPVWETMLP